MPVSAITPESVPVLSSTPSSADVLRRWSLRWGWRREDAIVPAGLYRLGNPGPDSPVLVTCNYRMTVDLVRRDTAGLDAWLLVLETYGVNVWCAAGKGTFSTDELVQRVFATHLAEYVDHSVVIVPQLGATGVAAHTVRELTGFRVVFGPIRSRDIRAFLDAGMKATDEMRVVTFTLAERIVLAPVELVGSLRWPFIAIPFALAAVSGFGPHIYSLAGLASRGPAGAAGYALGLLGGAVLVPTLLPWLPGRAFALKGAVAGGLLGAGLAWIGHASPLAAIASVMGAAAVSSFLGMQFTGATPYTSPSGVEYELRHWIPVQSVAAAIALVAWIASAWMA